MLGVALGGQQGQKPRAPGPSLLPSESCLSLEQVTLSDVDVRDRGWTQPSSSGFAAALK
jgi:hypothetical protein